MRGHLKFYWLNVAFLVTVVAVNALWFRDASGDGTSERYLRSPDGRYHWAEVGRDVLLVIRDGEYQEIVTPPPEGRNEVTSSGFCYRDGNNLLLSDLETGKKRKLHLLWDGILDSNFRTGENRLFERCEHSSARRSLGENPYSVDGVRLGMTRAEVEAVWGPLSSELERVGSTGSMVTFDNDGRVESIRGETLYENEVKIFAEDSSFVERVNIGHPKPFSGGYCEEPVVVYDQITLDDYEVVFENYNPIGLQRVLGTGFKRFAREHNLEKIRVELSYRNR